MSARIIQGNVFDVLPTLKPGSVDCAVTSPPYWCLRSYLPKGHALKSLELGSEPTPAAYVANMVKVFRLVRDVMADHGTCWLNVGDTYAYDGKWGGATSGKHRSELHRKNGLPREQRGTGTGLGDGSLCLIPQRLAIALQDDGWIVRSVIVWHKPAPMPSSVSGWAWRRCRVKEKAGWGDDSPHPDKTGGINYNHKIGRAEWSNCPGCKHCTPHGGYRLRRGSWRPTSSWEPVLMLAKSAGYFADGEPVRQPSAAATVSRNEYSRIIDDPDEQFAVKHDHETTADGANLRDVWKIAAEPLREKHYAAFPTELVHRCLAAGTSAKGYCVTCGAPWVRVVGEVTYSKNRPSAGNDPRSQAEDKFATANGTSGWRGNNLLKDPTPTLGWRQSCPCHVVRCASCSFMLEYSEKNGYSRMNKDEEKVQEVRSAVRNKEPALRSEVLQSSVLSDLSSQGAQMAGALEVPADAVQMVQDGVQADRQRPSVLQQGMRNSPPLQRPARMVSDDQGLHFGMEAGASEHQQDRVHDAASSGDGSESRSAASTRRGRASQKRSQGRQPSKKPGTDGKKKARRSAEETQNDDLLSSLREGHSPLQRCPQCQSDLIKSTQEPRPGLVLDCFAGSGRTGIEALRMGLDFVGVELNDEYVAMARRLLRDESPLFA